MNYELLGPLSVPLGMVCVMNRNWLVRDAVLAFLYAKSVTDYHGSGTNLDPSKIEESVHWAEAPLTEEEVQGAGIWLEKEGFVEGLRTFGGGILRPSITAKGERYADDGRSVKDDPASRQSSSFVVVQNSQGVTIANNSPHATQTVNVEMTMQKAREFADALTVAAQSSEAPEDAARQATDVADAIVEEAGRDEPDVNRLKDLAFRAATSIAGAFGSTVGGGLAQQGLELVQLLG